MKLSEYEGDKGLEVGARAFAYVMALKGNAKTIKSWERVIKASQTSKNAKSAKEREEKRDEVAKAIYGYFADMFINDKTSAIGLLALLEDKDPSEYKVSAPTIVEAMMRTFVEDDDLMRLFGLRTPTTEKETPSSGSASENTEG